MIKADHRLYYTRTRAPSAPGTPEVNVTVWSGGKGRLKVNEPPVSGHLSDVARYARQDIMSVEPPALQTYRDAPIYDHTVILQLVGVRPLALWAWEQHIGISVGARGTSELSGQKRRYSERDLVALLWLRERVIDGEAPQEAGARLIAAQRLRNSGALNSGALNSGGLSSGGLGSNGLNAGGISSGDLAGGGQSGSLGGAQVAPGQYSGPLAAGGQSGAYPGHPPQRRYTPSHSGPLQPIDPPLGATGGLGGSAYAANEPYIAGMSEGEYPSGSWATGGLSSSGQTRPGASSRPLTDRGVAFGASAPRPSGQTGRLGSVYSAPMPIVRPASGYDAARDQATARELRWLVSPMMEAFSRFDTAIANRLIQQALERYSVEVVCLGLAQPTIARVSELWSRSELTIPEERFALSYLRGFLASVFHSTMEPPDAPLAVVGCAQRETSDLAALMLAVFWRRSGLRVAYLGADAGADDLAQQRWAVVPAIICLTMSSTQRIRSVNHLAKQVRALPSPHAELCYAGAPFVRNPDLQRKVDAVYLGDDPASATTTVRRLLGMIF